MAALRAISLWQPWALLWLLDGEKHFETRHWYASYRGPLLIHAAKTNNADVRATIESRAFRDALDRHDLRISDIFFGGVIGRVEIIGCSQMSRMPEPSERERIWGLWEPDRYAWERAANPVIFREPIPYRGQQGFFSVPDELVSTALARTSAPPADSPRR